VHASKNTKLARAFTSGAKQTVELLVMQDTTALCLAGVPHREWSRNIPITTVGKLLP
jgi:hypothetical protein